MYTLNPSALFRSTSRPSSPAPAPSPVPQPDRARPLSKLSLSSFRRPLPSSPLPSDPLSQTVVQDGSFMEVLGLRLSEAVSKALAQPTGPASPPELLAGRRPIPPGRGKALGAIIVSETNAARPDPSLYRAVIRTLQRPLSVLLTNLSNNLIPLIASPAFSSPISPSIQDPHLNPTQLHAVAFATLAGELLEAFDQIGLGLDVDTRGESIKIIRDRLLSLVNRVVDPLLNAIKNDLLPHIQALETVAPPPIPTGPVAKAPGPIKSPLPHPSIMSMQSALPLYSRALARIVASAYAESALASLVISLVWRGMVALSHRPNPLPSPPASPSMGTNTLKSKDSKKTLVNPSMTPPPGRFTLKLPPSRPSTPPSPALRGPTVAADARALYNLLDHLPKPSATKEQTRLAREVVDEAFSDFSALIALLETIQVHLQYSQQQQHAAAAPAAPFVNGTTSPRIAPLNELEDDLDLLTAELPVVIALPILLRTYLPGERSVPAILGLSEDAYRKDCLSGFGRAEECGIPVGQRVLDVLRADAVVRTHEDAAALLKWLERELDAARAEGGGGASGAIVPHKH